MHVLNPLANTSVTSDAEKTVIGMQGRTIGL